MIKGASLSFAVVFCFLISLVCSGLFFVSLTNEKLRTIYAIRENIVFDAFGAIHISLEDTSCQLAYNFPNGDTCITVKENWGLFKIIKSRCFNKEFEFEKMALIGVQYKEILPSLYVTKSTSSLKIAGSTEIEGLAFVPNAYLERIYLSQAGPPSQRKIRLDLKKSSKSLPVTKLGTHYNELRTYCLAQNSEPFQNKDIHREFSEKTLYYLSQGAITIRNSISGNVIIKSMDSIFVSKEAKLKNAILISPIVIFEPNFKGQVQVFSSQKVHLGKGAILSFPSTVSMLDTIKNRDNRGANFIIDSNALVFGGVFIEPMYLDPINPMKMQIKKGAVIFGGVVCKGFIEHKGKTVGSVFSSSIGSSINGGPYKDVLIDTKLTPLRNDENFIHSFYMLTEDSEVEMTLLEFL